MGDTDLIIDLEGSVRNVAPLAVAIPPIFAKLHRGKNWRTVTIAGGSIPQMLTGYKVGTTFLDRQEWALWRTLAKSGLDFLIDFGDYANIAPDALDRKIPPGFPINARYTLPDKFLIRHGVRTIGPNAVKAAVQFHGHATDIAGYAQRAAMAQCWGDIKIDDIVARTISGGNPPVWVRYTVNRHLEITRHRLP